jgi:hypothetical protein
MSPVLTVNLAWLYTELTGDHSVSSVEPYLKPCRICKYFDDLFDQIKFNSFTYVQFLRHVYVFMDALYTTALSTKSKEHIAKLGRSEIIETLNKVYTTVVYEYHKCDCYRKTLVIKEEDTPKVLARVK